MGNGIYFIISLLLHSAYSAQEYASIGGNIKDAMTFSATLPVSSSQSFLKFIFKVGALNLVGNIDIEIVLHSCEKISDEDAMGCLH